MTDWFSKGTDMLYEEATEETGLTTEQFAKAYAFLNNVGIIDYDIEKEVIYERYFADEDEENEEDDD